MSTFRAVFGEFDDLGILIALRNFDTPQSVISAASLGGSAGEALFSLTGGTGAQGSLQVGDVLTAALVDGVKGIFQFTRDGVPIAGATNGAAAASLAYTVVPADAGKLISALVTGLQFAVTGAYAADAGGAPTLFALLIASDAPNVVQLVYDKNVRAPAPSAAAFTLGGTIATAKGVPAVAVVGNIVRLTYGNPFVFSDAPTLTYAVPGSNPISSTAGLPAAAIAQAIANQVTVPALVIYPYKANPQFEPDQFIVDHATGSLQLSQSAVDKEAYFQQCIFMDESLTGSQIYEGWVEMQVDGGAAERGIGLQDHGGQDSEGELDYRIVQSGGTVYCRSNSDTAPPGVGVKQYTFPNPASALNRARLRVTVAGSGMFMDTSVDGGTTWVQRFAFDGFASIAANGLFPWALLKKAQPLLAVKAVGLELGPV